MPLGDSKEAAMQIHLVGNVTLFGLKSLLTVLCWQGQRQSAPDA